MVQYHSVSAVNKNKHKPFHGKSVGMELYYAAVDANKNAGRSECETQQANSLLTRRLLTNSMSNQLWRSYNHHTYLSAEDFQLNFRYQHMSITSL